MDTNLMHAAPRCKARSKRTGEPCRAPAVTGWRVCRMHGAGGGAPRGERHGQFRHGRYTREAIAERRAARALVKKARETLRLLLGDLNV
jgi:hypothetical protein